MRRPVWSRQAERELVDLIGYYAKIDDDLPRRFIDLTDLAIAKLLASPRIGSPLPDSDDRQWAAAGTPFLLFYRETDRGIRILKVRDARFDWKPR